METMYVSVLGLQWIWNTWCRNHKLNAEQHWCTEVQYIFFCHCYAGIKDFVYLSNKDYQIRLDLIR